MENPKANNLDPNIIDAKLDQINQFFDQNLPKLDAQFRQHSPVVQNAQDGAGNVFTQPVDSKGLTKDLFANLQAKVATYSDPLRRSKVTSFDGSRFGYNFNRYYNHPKFKNLGFSIYNDNESEYTSRSTFLDDARRMGTQFWGLAGGAMYDNFKSWGDLLTGDFSPNTEGASLMEERLSIATSNRKGAGAWATNFVANSAYTIGMVLEMAAEEIALGAITAATFGGTSELAAVRTGQNVAGLSKSLAKLVRSFKDPNKAKMFYKSLQTGANALFNPFDNAGSFVKKALTAGTAENRLSTFAKTFKTGTAFYYDMRQLNAVLSESTLEGGFAQNDFVNQAVEEWKKANPSKEISQNELDDIYQRGKKAAAATVIGNIPAIYYSNKIVFDGLFKPIDKRLMRLGAQNSFYKIVKNSGWKAAGKTPYSVIEKGMFKKGMFTKDYLKSFGKGTWDALKNKPLPAALKSLKYLQANLVEGLQEVYQEGIQKTNIDYYLNQYYAELYGDPNIAAKNTYMEALKKGFGEQMSMQGLDVFMSGFLMGGPIQAVSNYISNTGSLLQMKFNDYKNKTTTYDDYVKSQKEQMDELVKSMNSLEERPYDYVNWLDTNVKTQRDFSANVQENAANGDINGEKNAKDDSLFMHVFTLIKNGKYDLFVDQLKDLKQTDPKELSEMFGNSPDIMSKIDNAIKKAEDIKSRMKKADAITNPFNPGYIDKKKNPDAYIEELNNYKAFEHAKMMSVYGEYSFDRMLKRAKDLAAKASTNVPVRDADSSLFTALYDVNQLRSLIETTKSEIEILEAEGNTSEFNKKSTFLDKLEGLKEAALEFSGVMDALTRSHNNPKYKQAVKEYARKNNLMNVQIMDENSQLSMFDAEGEDVDDSVDLNAVVEAHLHEVVRDNYMQYLKSIANLKNVFPITDLVDESINDYIDFLKLDVGAKFQAQNINILADPGSLLKMAKRISDITLKYEKNKVQISRNALERFKVNNKTNQLIQDIAKLDVYFDDANLYRLKNFRMFPNKFIDKDGNEVAKDSETFKKILELFDAYEELIGEKLKNKPTFTAKQETTTEETQEVKPQGTETTPLLKTYPVGLQTLLIQEHRKAMEQGGDPSIEEWMKDNPIAQSIIDKYNMENPVQEKPEPKPATANTQPTQDTEISDPLDKLNQVPVKSVSEQSQEMIEEVRKKLREKLLSSSAAIPETENGKYYVEIENSGKAKISSLKYHRVTRFKPNSKNQVSEDSFQTIRGNFIDEIFRQVLYQDAEGVSILKQIQGSFDQFDKRTFVQSILAPIIKATYITNASLSPSYKINGVNVFEKITDSFSDQLSDIIYDLAVALKDYNVYGDITTLWGEINGFNTAGTMDILVEKEGKFSIIDIKTSVKNREVEYMTGNSSLKEEDAIQLNIYAKLFKDLTGFEIDEIKIFPLQITEKVNKQNKKEGIISGSLLSIKPAKTEKGALKFLPVAKLTATEMSQLSPIESDTEEDESEQSERPTPKKQVPAKLKGKLIYVVPGTIPDLIYQDYDVVNVDDILRNVLLSYGHSSIEDMDSSQVGSYFYSLSQSQDTNAEYKEILEQIKDEVNYLKEIGQTIITTNWFYHDSADVVVAPDKSTIILDYTDEESNTTQIQNLLNKKYIKNVYDKVEKNANKEVDNVLYLQEPLYNILTEDSKVSPKVDTLKNADKIMEIMLALMPISISPIYVSDFYTLEENKKVPMSIAEIAKIAKNKLDELVKQNEDVKNHPQFNALETLIDDMINPKPPTPDGPTGNVNTVIDMSSDQAMKDAAKQAFTDVTSTDSLDVDDEFFKGIDPNC
jgi:hypothetical protein